MPPTNTTIEEIHIQGHEADDRAERAIGLVVAAKIRRVPGEQQRGGEPHDGREQAAWRDPAPFRLVAARAEAVEAGENEAHQNKQHRPLADLDHKFARDAERIALREIRQGDHHAERDQRASEHAQRENESTDIERDEAALLLLMIGDIEAVIDGLGARIRAL
jgi:hypothetical protein